ncbi:MAG: HAMP domain-containing sensor histidine kinase [candidate division Zixibacteria bacterium]|nr:HAMP domain-containing sensor histidine kinase [candidate division Zixibacteria bacterium]
MPDFQILNSLRDDLIHERKKKVASLEMILSTWEKGEGISTHLNYFKDLIGQLKIILKDQREHLLITSSDPFLWFRLRSQVLKIERDLKKIEKDKQEIQEIKKRLSIFSDEIEEILEKATRKFTFTLNEVIRESVKIVRTEKDRILKEKGIKLEERYEDIGERFRLPYKSYRDWQKLISNLIRNGVEAVETKLLATSYKLPAGVVRVLVGGKGDEVVIMVEDNGIGMDEKIKETFYKRGFTQGKEAGLGLGITEETVEFVNKYGSWNIESKINEGTRIEIKINKEKAKQQDLRVEDRSALVIKLKSRRVMFALAGVLVIAIGLGLYFQFNKYARFWEDWNPAYVEIDKGDPTNALVKNKEGKTVWTKKFDSRLSQNCMIVGDIDGDNRNEVVLGITSNQAKSGYVCCFDDNENELWRFEVGRKGIYPIGDIYSPHEIILVDLNNDKEKEIIISSFCANYYPDQIVILNKKGELKGEYWHSGNIGYKFTKDMDKDGVLEIVFSGINNKLDHSPVIVVLDSRKANGQSPPYLANNVPKAKEKLYVCISPIKEFTDKVRFYPQAGIRYLGPRQGYDEYSLYTSDGPNFGREFIVDQNFNVLQLYLSDTFLDEWRKLLDKKIVNYEITDVVKEKWKKFEIWKNGVRVQ